ncbi:hypothetical protein CBS101457_004519 [Exobasidium rhododendri]|nr:hypothetical protein CBS101457_004519 [Exobasidium rhododendri]
MSRHSEDSDSHASSFDEEDDQDWGDWVDDEEQSGLVIASSSHVSGDSKTVYHALFFDSGASPAPAHLQKFTSAREAIDHAARLGCNLLDVIQRCNLDTLQIIRLINYLRRQVVEASSPKYYPKANEINALTGKEPFLTDDGQLVPVPGYENDGLLQTDFDELSASIQEGEGIHAGSVESRRINELESQLYASHLAFEDLRKRFMEVSGLKDSLGDSQGSGKGKEKAETSIVAGKEDSHYFSSYASHDIHQTMISDKARTLSYAKFLLSPHNAHLLRGKVVMDVGCGSGILSLFAARAGAKQVLAIDASDVADRARENIRSNGMEGIITVYKGKMEELGDRLDEYKGKVDVIVSEWMGYFLLYESMLPSVLYARDVYLRKGGLLAPSHTRMVLAAVADCSLISDRLRFWDNVHGFSMNAMKVGLVDEAWTDTLEPNQVVSSVDTIYELPLQSMSAQQPSFRAPFSIQISRKCSVQAFASWFDTWFTPDGQPLANTETGNMEGGQDLEGLPPVTLQCPQEADVRGLLSLQKDGIVARDTDGPQGKGETVSFTTGPHGLETHWKQTFFVLKEPIEVEEDSVIVGELGCKPNEENTREVDVEIHYSVRNPSDAVKAGKKSVETRTVQLFAVR